MGLLDPPADAVWDIRSRDPRPAIRIIGHFADTDLFIGLTWAPRSVPVPWSNRPPLGEGGSEQWKLIIRECKAAWRRLFPSYDPYSGDTIHDYISNGKVFLV